MSIGMACLRAKFWSPAVRKDCTKKKPDSQKMEGAPFSYQLCSPTAPGQELSQIDCQRALTCAEEAMLEKAGLDPRISTAG